MSDINALNPAQSSLNVRRGRHLKWRPLHRIDTVGGSVNDVSVAINSYPFERLVYAEDDSWLDKFTPLGKSDTNLLDAIRVPIFAGVVGPWIYPSLKAAGMTDVEMLTATNAVVDKLNKRLLSYVGGWKTFT